MEGDPEIQRIMKEEERGTNRREDMGKKIYNDIP
jgi:hypothetical protein